VIDIRSDGEDKRGVRLSNFPRREFELDGAICNSLEGFLQALKASNRTEQVRICQLVGKEAKLAGHLQNWSGEKVYWRERVMPRRSAEFFELVCRAYDSAYHQDPTFARDLLVTGHEELRHTIGRHDPRATILTEVEFLCQLYRLRTRAHFEVSPQNVVMGLLSDPVAV